MWYFAPDSLRWEGLEMGYSDFLCWCFSGKVDQFYESWRWAGWESEVEKVAGDAAYSIYPPLWAEGPEIGLRARRPVPVAEVFGMTVGRL